MGKLLRALGIKRPGLNFYALRHTFETIAGDSGDQVATSYIMGHAPSGSDMSATYREKVFSHRLYAVAKHVRRWLYGRPGRKRADRKGASRPDLTGPAK
jgi:integrase